MIRAQARELAPMTATWSSCGPGAAVLGREPDADLVPPDLGIHEDPVQVEDDRVDQLSAPFGGGRSGTGSAASFGLGRSGAGRGHDRHRSRPPIDGVVHAEHEFRDGVGVRVGAAQDVALDLEVDQSMATLDLDRHLAELDPTPTDELAGGPWTLARDVDADVDLGQARRLRDEQRIADGRIVAPDDPALGVDIGAQHGQRRLDRRDDLGSHRILARRGGAPIAQAHGPSLQGSGRTRCVLAGRG